MNEQTCTQPKARAGCKRLRLVQPALLKMRLEMVIGMQIEILIGIKKLPFYASFQIFN